MTRPANQTNTASRLTTGSSHQKSRPSTAKSYHTTGWTLGSLHHHGSHRRVDSIHQKQRGNGDEFEALLREVLEEEVPSTPSSLTHSVQDILSHYLLFVDNQLNRVRQHEAECLVERSQMTKEAKGLHVVPTVLQQQEPLSESAGCSKRPVLKSKNSLDSRAASSSETNQVQRASRVEGFGRASLLLDSHVACASDDPEQEMVVHCTSKVSSPFPLSERWSTLVARSADHNSVLTKSTLHADAPPVPCPQDLQLNRSAKVEEVFQKTEQDIRALFANIRSKTPNKEFEKPDVLPRVDAVTQFDCDYTAQVAVLLLRCSTCDPPEKTAASCEKTIKQVLERCANAVRCAEGSSQRCLCGECRNSLKRSCDAAVRSAFEKSVSSDVQYKLDTAQRSTERMTQIQTQLQRIEVQNQNLFELILQSWGPVGVISTNVDDTRRTWRKLCAASLVRDHRNSSFSTGYATSVGEDEDLLNGAFRVLLDDLRHARTGIEMTQFLQTANQLH